MYGIFTYIWLILVANVGKYTSPMDGMGYGIVYRLTMEISSHQLHLSTFSTKSVHLGLNVFVVMSLKERDQGIMDAWMGPWMQSFQ